MCLMLKVQDLGVQNPMPYPRWHMLKLMVIHAIWEMVCDVKGFIGQINILVMRIKYKMSCHRRWKALHYLGKLVRKLRQCT